VTEEEHRVGDRQFLVRAHIAQLHAAAELAGAEAHKGNAVAMVGVHVGLDLEYEACDLALVGKDRLRLGRLRPGLGRPITQRPQQFGDADGLEGRTENDRGQVSGAEGLKVKGGEPGAHQLEVFERVLDHRIISQRFVEQ